MSAEPTAVHVNMHEAKTQLSRLVQRVEGGEEVVISRAGRPVARLVPLGRERPQRQFGRLRGKMWIAEDFDDTAPELLTLFEGSTG